MKTKLKLFVFVSVLISLLTACVWNEEVKPNQVGIISDAGNITRCVTPGLQNEGGMYTDLQTYTIDPITFDVSNASVATEDTQIVSVKVSVQARRKSDCDSTKKLYTSWASLLVDENLVTSVSAIAAQSIKSGVRGYSLAELLNDRNGLGTSILTELRLQPLAEVVEFITVAVSDVDVDDAYEALLQDKANLTAQIDLEARRQDLIEQQASNSIFEQEQRALAEAARLQAEQATTLVEVEIAAREGQKTAAKYQVYVTNPEAFELERLRLLSNVYNDKTVIIVPENSDLNLFANPLAAATQPVVVTNNP